MSKLFLLILNLIPCFCNLHQITQLNESSCQMTKVLPRLIGGSPIREQTSVPYMAAIGNRIKNRTEWFCGGSLISRKFVLTAAHCFSTRLKYFSLTGRRADVVRLGTTYLQADVQEYKVADTHVHPSYDLRSSYNDLALIELRDRIETGRSIWPICLPEDDYEDFAGKKAQVLGWGTEEIGGETTQELKQVEVTIFSNKKCEQSYSNSSISQKSLPHGILSSQLCAGDKEGGKDACQGDSGGPLVISDPKGIIRIIGVVSTGSGCGSKTYPGVYARVSTYLNWIKHYV